MKFGKSFIEFIKAGQLAKRETEESISFRILVQLLVSIGIIATDIAAETSSWVWAIPLSAIGGLFSWYQRKKKNVFAKFCLAAGMIVVLIHFFGDLLANLNDTRSVLAQLLIQLQVLHSFDQPRRKDLGYSMVIGLILMAVAGTLSQTMLFAPFLILFLSVALPALHLDYRSRLGLSGLDNHMLLSQKYNADALFHAEFLYTIVRWLFAIVVIGLLLFVGLPRFNAYQFQSFPVSGPASLQDLDFNEQNHNVLNSGSFKPKDQSKNSLKPEQGSLGSADETQYYGFNSTINQNLRGHHLKELTVMRVRSQFPGYWRVMAFDRYTGQGWKNSQENTFSKLNRDFWNYRFYIPSAYTKAPSREVIQSYNILSPLPNILPLLSNPTSVFFPTRQLSLDNQGSLRSPTILSEGMTYSVISQVPYRQQNLLRRSSHHYLDFIRKKYLDVPPEIKDKIKSKTLEILSKSGKPFVFDYDRVLYLTQALKQNFSLIDNLPKLVLEEDLVEAFLFKYKGGYGDHFSTVLAMMLRSIGIPSRLAVGFAPGQFNPFTGYYVVKNTDAYAICEVYFLDYGWYAFDPLPGHPLFPPSIEEDDKFSILKEFWKKLASFLPSPVLSFCSILWNLLVEHVLKFVFFIFHLFPKRLLFLWWLGLGFIIVFVLYLTFRLIQNLQLRFSLARLKPVERIYRQMLMNLEAQGYPKHPAQTPLEYAKECSGYYNDYQIQKIDHISRAYVAWRYGNLEQNIDNLQQKLKELKLSLSGFKKK